MGFRGSRVKIPPSRLSEDQALQRLLLWGFFFALPHAVSNAVSFYPLTIRCVGCNTTFLIVSARSEEHTSELQSQSNLVCRLLLETKNPGGGRWRPPRRDRGARRRGAPSPGQRSTRGARAGGYPRRRRVLSAARGLAQEDRRPPQQ